MNGTNGTSNGNGSTRQATTPAADALAGCLAAVDWLSEVYAILEVSGEKRPPSLLSELRIDLDRFNARMQLHRRRLVLASSRTARQG
jgi:hypothetical protein